MRWQKHTEEEWLDMTAEEVFDDGVELGIERGINKERKSIATNMKRRNMTSEEISEITGLTVEEIKSL